MFDAAGFVTGAEVTADAVAESQADAVIENTTPQFESSGSDTDLLMAALAGTPNASPAAEIVFIDTSVADYEVFLEGIDPNAEVVLLDSGQDGLAQIAATLEGRTDIDAIHIISHGDSGELQLGSANLNLQAMQGEYAETLTTLGSALSADADILIYGCNFAEGETGLKAAETLSTLTGADVAASTDLTGHSDAGGDWALEYQSGRIEAASQVSAAAQQAFSGLLMDTDGDGIDDSTDIDDDNDGVLDSDEGLGEVVTQASGNYDILPNANTNAPSTLTTTVNLTGTGLEDGDIVTLKNFLADGDLNSSFETFDLIFNDGRPSELSDGTTTGLLTGGQFGGLEPLNSNPTYSVTVVDLDGPGGSDDVGILLFAEANASVDALGNPYVVRITFDIEWTQTDGQDSDGDTIPDHLDIDSDNDGITDTVEAQATEAYRIPSGAGAGITDDNSDGLDDNFDAGVVVIDGVIDSGAPTGFGFTPVDSDGDGLADILDPDSDNDTTPDIAERGDQQPTSLTSSTDTDGDGLVDIFESSSIIDADVNDENLTGLVFNLADTDNDLAPNGADAVGLTQNLDFRENVNKDVDEDGITNNLDVDADNDGIININEGWTVVPTSVNSTTLPNSQATTNIEVVPVGGGAGSSDVNIDLSGTGLEVGDKLTVSNFLVDGDLNGGGETFSLNFNSGEQSASGLRTGAQFTGFVALTTPLSWEITVVDIDDGAGVTPGINVVADITAAVDFFSGRTYGIAFNFDLDFDTFTETDSDLDGVPDHLDIDSDNDGITDTVEAQETNAYKLPSGVGTGIVDTNIDGLDDNFDDVGLNGVGLSLEDTDNDGTDDLLDADSDNDGIPDIEERGDGAPITVTSTSDIDFDGLLDIFEGSTIVDLDINDENVSGTSTATLVFNFADSDADTDDDGQNASQPNIDLDYRENQFADIDNDGFTNDVDIDADNDGILNTDEGFGATTISSGNLDARTGADGEADPVTVVIDLSAYSLAIGSSVTISNLEAEGDLNNGGETFDLIFNQGEASEESDTGLATGQDYGGLSSVTTSISTVEVIDIDGLGTPGIKATVETTDNVDANNGFTYAARVVFDISFTSVRDTDGDGLLDYLDIDSDNDGITDNIEAQDTNAYIFPAGSVNGSGLDTNYTGGPGLSPVDTDGDLIPDFIDADSDNDGRGDIAERGDGQPVVASNNADADSDGLLDVFEGAVLSDLDANDENVSGTGTMTLVFNLADTNDNTDDNGANASPPTIDLDFREILTDADGDGIPNNIDVDADNDGILNTDEGSALGGSINTGNIDLGNGAADTGVVNIDLSGNGLIVGDTVYVTNVLADGDLDSDASIEFFRLTLNQGEFVSQNLETGLEFAGLAAISEPINVPLTVVDIGSGVPGIQYQITTPEGVNDINPSPYGVRVTFDVVWSAPDFDGDGQPDWLDIDSDNDGITDNVEAQTTGGYVAPSGVDNVSIGGAAVPDGLDDTYGSGLVRVDTDSDSTADVYDDDSDNDGIADIAERGDGQPRTVFSTVDTDADGLLDIFEGSELFDLDPNDENLDPTDTTFNLSDVDGVDDLDYRDRTDTDGDGVDNVDDDDADNDGILNVNEGLTATPGSLTSPNIDIAEGDTMTSTATTTSISLAGTGLILGDTVTVSNVLADGDLDDAIDEVFSLEFNNNGTVFDDLQTGESFKGPTDLTTPINTELTVIDIGSGVPGIQVQAVTTNEVEDEISFGYAVRFTVEVSWTAPDTDGDGVFDYLDLDSDNDGLSDLFESGSTAGIAADTNFDGTISLSESSESGDGDGVLTVFETTGTTPQDNDGDGIDDLLDLDSDDDGIADTIEFRPTAGYVANDGDVRDNDADGDGVIDLFDSNDNTTGVFGGTFSAVANDADGDGTPDYLDADSDSDASNDSVESGFTFDSADLNLDGIDDNASIGVSFADPDGVVSNPATDLPNQAGDTSEIAFRESELVATDDIVQIGEVNESTGATLSADPTGNDTYDVDPFAEILVTSVSSATSSVPTPVPGVGSVSITTDLGAQVTVSADGTIVYDPNGQAALTNLNFGDAPVLDSFTYTITVAGISSSASVDITVQPNNEFELDSLTSGDGSDGTIFAGSQAGDYAGFQVMGLGDINGDGYDDIAINAVNESTNAFRAGATYVIFGTPDGLGATFDLDSLDDGGGTDGFVIRGIDNSDQSGRGISAGDINGDGYSDIILSASRADPNDALASGEIYVIFGTDDFAPVLSMDSGNSGVFELASLAPGDGTHGFVLHGAAADDNAGRWVAYADDVNGDGFGDFLIGAPFADYNGGYAGETYLIFGQSTSDFMSILGTAEGSEPGTYELADIATGDGTVGTVFYGEAGGDYSGNFVAGAGDFNGDGLHDIVIGAYYAGAGYEGASYLIYGDTSGFGAEFELSSLDGSNGFEVTGAAGDFSGKSLALFDFNGDGLDDLVVAAPYADVIDGPTTYSYAGVTYVIYGQTGTPFSGSQTLAATADIAINGALADNTGAGFKVTSAGDVNSDGFDDLLIGRLPYAGVDEGAAYVIFGGDSLASTIELSSVVPDSSSTAGGGATLTVPTGFVLAGINSDDYAGQAVVTVGDFDGDGYDDLLIGAYYATANATYSGEAYLIYGKDYLDDQPLQGSDTDDTLSGSLAQEVLIGGDGNDLLSGGLGNDVLIGANGDDTLVFEGNDSRRIDGGGGEDTLSFVGRAGITLDLTTVSNAVYRDIEIIDLTGVGNNSLVLSTLDLLALSGSTNVLTVNGNSDDTVVLSDFVDWTSEGMQSGYNVYSNGEAEIRIQSGIEVSDAAAEETLAPAEQTDAESELLAELLMPTESLLESQASIAGLATFSDQVFAAQSQFNERASNLLNALVDV